MKVNLMIVVKMKHDVTRRSKYKAGVRETKNKTQNWLGTGTDGDNIEMDLKETECVMRAGSM
jgi:hypothetical protein